MALEGLGHERDRALARPELRDGDADAPKMRLSRIGRTVERAGQTHHQDRRRFGLDREVREDIHHQRLLAERFAERAAVRRVMRRLRDRLPHE